MEKELINRILEANKAYRNGNEIISDTEYDMLLDELNKKYPNSYSKIRPLLIDSLDDNDIDLPIIAGSLKKLVNGDDSSISKWFNKQDTTGYTITSKVDGLSLIVCYNNGRLEYIATRGDGKSGKNKTERLRKIVPEKLTGKLSKGLVVIKGEGVVTYESFRNLNDIGHSYNNIRSAAVGLCNSKGCNNAGEFITFIAYHICISDYAFNNYHSTIEELQAQGFSTPKMLMVDKPLKSEGLLKIYNSFKSSEPFDIDGIVIQNDNQFNELDQFLPEHSIAFKANTNGAIAKIIDFEWNTSKDGRLCPVAIIEPTKLNGSTITRVSVHNIDWIKENGLGIGSEVFIQLRGDIIPGIVSTITKSNKFELPIRCPCCGSKLKLQSKFLYCESLACPAKSVKGLEFFLKNLQVNYAGSTSLANWKLTSISQLLQFVPCSRQQEKFYNELETKLWNISEMELLSAFNYFGIGKKTIEKIISANSVDAFIDKFFKRKPITLVLPTGVSKNTIKKIELVSGGLAKDFFDIISDEKWHAKYNKFSTADSKDSPLTGQSFCFTGALTIPRKMAESLVKSKGGQVKSAVNKGLTYLVTNDANSGSSKCKSAIKLGTNIISEKSFFAIVGYELPSNLKTIASIVEQKKKHQESNNLVDLNEI